MASGTVRYRRVATREDPDLEEQKKRRDELVDKISTKIQAAAWVTGAGAMTYFTDLPRKLVEDERVDRLFLNISIVCLMINCCLMAYLTIYVPFLERRMTKEQGQPVTLRWEIYCPRMIPTMTVLGIAVLITGIQAIWPVFGWLSPLIVFLEFMGFVMSLHFIPFPC
mmetsp:Transcript_8211/g.23354  ORF Transcript_8211/g.23354 Transcript_8211/m.23354 type:complete len:167 (-) Transcript_8211:189-689(-)